MAAPLHRASSDLVAALVKLRAAIGTLQSGQPLDPIQRRDVVPTYFKALAAFHDAVIEAVDIDGGFEFDNLAYFQDVLAVAVSRMTEANEQALPPNDENERLSAQQLGVGRYR